MCTIIFLDKIPLQLQSRIFMGAVPTGLLLGLCFGPDGDQGGP
jgi:hypothetical protein